MAVATIDPKIKRLTTKGIIIAFMALAIAVGAGLWKEVARESKEEATAIQIYPNYDFPKGVNQIKVPLLPMNQRLAREAGGWVITPTGSEYRIDYEVPVVIEYNDGRKFYRQPKQPAHDGVRLANSIFRLYGERGDVAITIKRGVY